MAEEVFPRKFAYVVKQGFDRVEHYRRARALLIRAYVGRLYRNHIGDHSTDIYSTGDSEPLNMIFNAIRSTVPNLVQKPGANKVVTDNLEYRDYAFLLSKALDVIDKRINLKDILRRNVVDAMFGLGVMKGGLARGGNILNFGDTMIEEGQVFVDNVDLDDLTIDPICKQLREAAFIGDGTRIPRQILLDDDSFDHDAVLELPRSYHPDSRRRADAITRSNMSQVEMDELQDHVDVVEVYVPEANTKIVMADPRLKIMNRYLSINEYYGPKRGPYIFTALTQPVPGNPFPVAPVGIWLELHNATNEIAAKVIDQAKRQKDLLIADPAYEDEAEDARTEPDGGFLVGNPEGYKAISLGGQNEGNQVMLGSLHTWFNYMAGNPDQLAGQSGKKGSATEATIDQSNLSVVLEDTRDMAESSQAEANELMAWYLHTDPLIDMLLTTRKPGQGDVQLQLTPEERRGDFLDYTFTTKRRTMVNLAPEVRSRRMMEFATKVVVSLANTAVMLSQIGVPFNMQRALTDLAEEWGILDEVYDWLEDPEFIQRITMMAALGPQNTNQSKAGGGGSAGVMQNGGSSMAPSIPSADKEMRQGAQMGANDGQSVNFGVF